ncbi:hypothetical protein SAMN05660772_00518 [Pasteurella testudinis DSM 23072]|uniref:Uncharacterized protein n=1 Tax=Pasteurella testudinis DSM 23072 TaxID=1122938 RepID=A0A1W1UG60_9PAST|nr:hypothetical protein [Pasteurella testudinis]SMB80012.1 hypothetical protein SAMN05660772_00518 [Pasteurella testudinis DSM 23072]SUB50620.1 Uncharacterised protein [Pasteurella testudinis]
MSEFYYAPREKFNNWEDFFKFEKKLSECGLFELTKAPIGVVSFGFVKSWYINKETEELWCLTEPDPPFPGEWKNVSR